MLATPCFAASVTNKAIDRNDGDKVKLSGRSETDETVTLQVLRCDKETAKAKLEKLTGSDYELVAYVKPENGVWNAVLQIGARGIYTIASGGDGSLEFTELAYASSDDLTDFLGLLSKCKTKAAAEEFFEKAISGDDPEYTNADIFLGFDRELFNSCTSKALICSHLAEYISGAGTLAGEDVAELITVYNAAAALTILNETDNAQLALETIERFSAELKMSDLFGNKIFVNEKDADGNTEYLIQNQSKLRLEVAAACMGKGFETVQDFGNQLNEASVLKALDNLKAFSGAEKLLDDGYELLRSSTAWNASSWTSYKSMQSGKADILKAVINKGYVSTEALLEDFKNAVKAKLGQGSQGGTGGSSGGGGGGSYGGSAIGSYEEKSENKDNNDNTGNNANTKLEVSYTDTEAVPWAAEGISALSEKGILNGTGNGRFEPMNYVTREQLVKILVLSFNAEAEKMSEAAETTEAAEATENAETAETVECRFADADENEWYYSYIVSGLADGVINGISETHFGVGESVTREDLCVLAYRYIKLLYNDKLEGAEEKYFIDDEEISDYAKEAVRYLGGMGVISGDENGCFLPRNYATRAETAKIIFSILKIIELL